MKKYTVRIDADKDLSASLYDDSSDHCLCSVWYAMTAPTIDEWQEMCYKGIKFENVAAALIEGYKDDMISKFTYWLMINDLETGKFVFPDENPDAAAKLLEIHQKYMK
jgi:hypothetical protein